MVKRTMKEEFDYMQGKFFYEEDEVHSLKWNAYCWGFFGGFLIGAFVMFSALLLTGIYLGIE